MSKRLLNEWLLNDTQPTVLSEQFQTWIKKILEKVLSLIRVELEEIKQLDSASKHPGSSVKNCRMCCASSLHVDEVVAALIALHSQLTGPPLLHL